ncbi:hypothetical protein Sme01_43150 [Sphaerisporangium melleum]|uniref:Uncharacterized protein n=1 Tax=Sphaerisporangium melleum TaxID=321316 RepID=A0A917VGG4_9ACTN|nr:hypothetical protein [Sphaerisporangium melleum]GGK77364.1 hypothetical protein GCM10007964_20110 [Sphaerisporangium melleum]GII71839.1 hypothetical protein Sme01_43150 [Sphaerisporangium melleum]
MTEGHRVLLSCGERGRELRAKGFTYEQIADVLALDLHDSPLLLHRYAHGLTAAQVVAAFNDLDPAGTASMRTARLYDLEAWPQSRRRPSPRVLDLLARIYKTTARRLVTEQAYATYSPYDRELLDAIDYRHLDPCQLIHLKSVMPETSRVSMETTGAGGPVEVKTPAVTETSVMAGPSDCVALFRALTAEEADVQRRELLFELAVVLGGIPALRLLRHLTPDEETRLANVIRGVSRVDSQTVTSIEKLIAHCWQLDEMYGPTRLLPVVDAQRDLLVRLLRHGSPPSALRDRILAACWAVSHLGGWLRYDLLDYAGAISWYRQGLEAAYELGDPTLLAHAHDCLSLTYGYQGKATVALDHSYAALAWVKESPSRLQRAATSLALSRALADAGRGEDGLRALDRAYDDAAASRTEADPPHLYWCTPAHVQRNAGYCLVALKRADQALSISTRTLAEVGSAYTRTRAFVTLELASALVQKREIAAAAEKIANAAELTARHTSLRLVDAIQKTRQRLTPWAGNAFVRDLDEKLRPLGVPTGGPA